MNESVRRSEPPESNEIDDDEEALGEVDETFAVRRVQRWLQGMFGLPAGERDEPPKP